MPAPTEAESQAQIRAAVDILETVRVNGESSTPNLATKLDTFVQLAEGEFATEALDGAEQIRGRYAGLLDEAAGRALINPLLRHLARARNFPDRDPDAILGRYYQDCIDNSKSVTSRAVSFGTPAAGGSNVGNGVLNRLTVDENNMPIEAVVSPETKTLECTLDRNSGTDTHQEQFEVRGQAPSKDGLENLASALQTTIVAASARHSADFLVNPSFSTDAATASPTVITGWTVTSLGNFEIISGTYYRDLDGEANLHSLKFKGNDTLVQTFLTAGKVVKFPTNVPMYCQIAWNREVGSLNSGCTLTLKLGNTTASVSLTTQTGWNVLRLALNQNLWFKNFNKAGLTLEVQLQGWTSGYLLVDDVILVPMVPLDGTWYALVGGATPFLKRDTFSVVDTGGTAGTGKINYWLHRLYSRYLPTSGSPTFTDP